MRKKPEPIPAGYIADMANKEFLAFAKEAERQDLNYLILGAACLTFQGLARNTHDVDIWVNPTASNMAALSRTLKKLGYSELDSLDAYEVGQPRFWHLAGPIDIMTVAHRQFDFDECFSRKVVIQYRGVDLLLMHLLDVRDLKIRARRDQDLRDAIIIDNFLREHGMPLSW